MNHKLGTSEFMEEGSCEKKTPMCDRCWIFKRNTKFLQGKNTRGQAPLIKKESSVSRYDEHKRFLARLREYQESLPTDDMEQPVVVNQLTPDSGDVRNIFVNNIIRSKGNINLKAIVGSMDQSKKEQPTSLMNVRSLRLTRKCKMANSIIPDEIDLDDDILLGEIKFTRSKKSETRKLNDDADTETSNTNVKIKTGENMINPLDELLGETELPLKSVKPKKRKMESITGDNKNSTTDIKEMLDKFSNSSVGDNMKNTNKKTNGMGHENFTNVIEIDGDGGIKEIKSEEQSNQKTSISCPMCNKLFSSDEINNHAYTCQGPQTKTRKQNSVKNSHDVSCNYDKMAWEAACKGLAETARKQKEPIEQCSEKTNGGNETNTVTSKNKHSKLQTNDRLHKFKTGKANERLNGNRVAISEHNPSKIMTSDAGYMDLANPKSAKNLFESYAKSIHNHKIKSKNPPAKQMRTFGEPADDEHDMIRCAKCDEFIPDDQIKSHTDLCINEESLLIE